MDGSHAPKLTSGREVCGRSGYDTAHMPCEIASRARYLLSLKWTRSNLCRVEEMAVSSLLSSSNVIPLAAAGVWGAEWAANSESCRSAAPLEKHVGVGLSGRQ